MRIQHPNWSCIDFITTSLSLPVVLLCLHLHRLRHSPLHHIPFKASSSTKFQLFYVLFSLLNLQNACTQERSLVPAGGSHPHESCPLSGRSQLGPHLEHDGHSLSQAVPREIPPEPEAQPQP